MCARDWQFEAMDEDSNLIQLLHLQTQDVPVLMSWLACKESKWLSRDILNELEVMAHYAANYNQ